jgi:DNA invertase Pin-like site-specific DNA recombinase
MSRRARKPGNPKVAIGYLRVSTDKQHLGPEAQRMAIERWAGSEGISVVDWHTDPDVTGASELEDRPGLIAALASLRAHGAGVLAVGGRDRLARKVEVAVALERAVRGTGAIVATADGRNDDGPSGKLIRQIEDALAEHERELISARTKAALAVLKSRGRSAGNVPYGFELAKDGPRSRSGRPATIVPCPAEQAVCARVMRLHDQGVSERKIERELRWSVKSRKGHALTDTQIHDIIAHAPALRAVFPTHAAGRPPERVCACARGHIYDGEMLGKYCVRGACKEGRGDGAAARLIEWRAQ